MDPWPARQAQSYPQAPEGFSTHRAQYVPTQISAVQRAAAMGTLQGGHKWTCRTAPLTGVGSSRCTTSASANRASTRDCFCGSKDPFAAEVQRNNRLWPCEERAHTKSVSHNPSQTFPLIDAPCPSRGNPIQRSCSIARVDALSDWKVLPERRNTGFRRGRKCQTTCEFMPLLLIPKRGPPWALAATTFCCRAR
jgi:hypothetical protein